MNKIDVLLLNLPTGTWYKKKLAEGNSMPPLGIMYIGTYLKKNNYTVKIIDLAVENLDENQFFQAIEECNPSIIGMSTYNEAWNVQKILCRRIKQKYPNIIIAAGGAFATFCYEQVLNESMTDREQLATLSSMPPLGQLYIATYLEKYGYTELRKNLEEYEAELIVPDNSKLRVDRPGMKIKHVEVNKIRQYYDIAERMFKKNN